MNKINGFKTISLTLVIAFLSLGLLFYSCDSNNGSGTSITGFVLSGDEPIESAEVTLFSTGTPRGVELLGTGLTDDEGFFRIRFNLPPEDKAVLYVTAQSPILATSQQRGIFISDSVRLATVLGRNRWSVRSSLPRGLLWRLHTQWRNFLTRTKSTALHRDYRTQLIY